MRSTFFAKAHRSKCRSVGSNMGSCAFNGLCAMSAQHVEHHGD
jgi:hypothetical protein